MSTLSIEIGEKNLQLNKNKKSFNFDLPLDNTMIQSTEEIINVLLELGLNNYEAKVYCALTYEGIATAKNLSDITSIPYGKVYEIINSLAKKGFLELFPSKPMKCKALQPSKVIKMIKDQTTEKLNKLGANLIQCLEEVYQEKKEFINTQNNMLMLNGRSNINKKIEEMLINAKKNVCILTTDNGLRRLVFHKAFLKQAAEKGVEVMVGSTLTKENEEDSNSLKFLNVKHLPKIKNNVVLVDGKEALLIDALPDDDNILYGRDSGLYITNNSFTKFLEDSFQTNYQKGKILKNNILL